MSLPLVGIICWTHRKDYGFIVFWNNTLTEKLLAANPLTVVVMSILKYGPKVSSTGSPFCKRLNDSSVIR